MSQSLFNIQREYLEIVTELEDNGGELTPELETALAVNKEELQDKCQAYIWIINQLEGQKLVAMNEVTRLTDFVMQKDKTINSLKQGLLFATQLYGVENQKSKAKHKPKQIQLDTITLSESITEAVEIVDITKIDEKFISYSPKGQVFKEDKEKLLSIMPTLEFEPSASKKEIKEAIDAGEEVLGARIIENNKLKIK